MQVRRSTSIPRGTVGEISYVVQRALELQDAHGQKNPILALNDAAGVVGGITAWLRKHHPALRLDDLIKMATAMEEPKGPSSENPCREISLEAGMTELELPPRTDDGTVL